MAELIGPSGSYDYIQSTEPNDPSTGETWLDTSKDPNGSPKIYASFGGDPEWKRTPTLAEVQSGRTRELLLALQKSGGVVSNIIDSVNSGKFYQFTGDKFRITDSVSESDGFGSFNTSTDTASVSGSRQFIGETEITVSSSANGVFFGGNDTATGSINGNVKYDKVSGTSGGGASGSATEVLPAGTHSYSASASTNDGGSSDSSGSASYTFVPNLAELVFTLDAGSNPANKFSNWAEIKVEGVDSGGSSKSTPVEFELLDSSNNTLTSTRIPTSLIADKAFRFTDRNYIEIANNSQSDYTIPETGFGGHYGLNIAPTAVYKNGLLVDSSNWSVSGKTVSIDTGSVTVNNGDEIEIDYDIVYSDDVLNVKSYLKRGSYTETSPSFERISYRYETQS